MPEPVLILVPPSEGKAAGGDGSPWGDSSMEIPSLDPQRRAVIAALRSAMKGSVAARSKLLGVKGDALAAATVANLHVDSSPTMAAIDRYTGVLYSALDAATLNAVSRRRLARSTLVVSGLWGLVAPNDPVPDYKLKMSASLPKLGRLSTWWRPELSTAVAERVAARSGRRSRPDRVVWNLLPGEHNAALRLPDGVESVSAQFLEPRNDGSLVAVSHWNKLHKGALVRVLVSEGICRPEDLLGWRSDEGYELDPARCVQDGSHRTLSFVKVH